MCNVSNEPSIDETSFPRVEAFVDIKLARLSADTLYELEPKAVSSRASSNVVDVEVVWITENLESKRTCR